MAISVTHEAAVIAVDSESFCAWSNAHFSSRRRGAKVKGIARVSAADVVFVESSDDDVDLAISLAVGKIGAIDVDLCVVGKVERDRREPVLDWGCESAEHKAQQGEKRDEEVTHGEEIECGMDGWASSGESGRSTASRALRAFVPCHPVFLQPVYSTGSGVIQQHSCTRPSKQATMAQSKASFVRCTKIVSHCVM